MPDTYLLRPAVMRRRDAAAREALLEGRRARAMAGRMIDNFWRKSAIFLAGAAGASPRPQPVQLRG